MAGKKTLISEVGEFGLIDRLTKNIKLVNKSSAYGVGDDAAVLDYNKKNRPTGARFVITAVSIKFLCISFNLNFLNLR